MFLTENTKSCFRAALNHIKNDVNYPASKDDILKACSGFSEVSASERTWFEQNIPNRTFGDASEVVSALLDKL
jgi:hypothetical protein